MQMAGRTSRETNTHHAFTLAKFHELLKWNYIF